MRDSIPKDKLRALFANHCECRPLDFMRASDDHAAIHDCDTGILLDIQIALGLRTFDGITTHEAQERCAKLYAEWKT